MTEQKNIKNPTDELKRMKDKEERDKAESLRKKKATADFKRKYFDLYDDVKISYKEDW